MIRLPCMEVTVPTLECVTEPQPYCGVDTDGRTWTRLPTWSEHALAGEEEEEEEQAVAPAVRNGRRKRQLLGVPKDRVAWSSRCCERRDGLAKSGVCHGEASVTV